MSDGDGYAHALGGGDCDDSNPEVHPGAIELGGNGIDENCDGEFIVAEQEQFVSELWPVPLTDLGFQLPYSIVLITVDGLSADHIGFYGYDRVTTPGIDRLAAESVVFQQAYSPSPAMAASIAAIQSGRFPSELSRLQGASDIDDAYWEDNTFLAEALESKGYYTAAFLSHSYLNRPFGLKDGFAKWQTHGIERSREPFCPVCGNCHFIRRRTFTGSRAESDPALFLLASHHRPSAKASQPPGYSSFWRVKDRPI